MNDTALIVGGLAAGGLALFLYAKAKQKQDECIALCKQAGGDQTECAVGCKLGEGLLNWLGDLADSVGNGHCAKDNSAEVAKRNAQNKALNGATQLPLDRGLTVGPELSGPGSSGGVALQGDTLRYENGCVPFSGHPDFAKCAPGTQSMWYAETNDAIGCGGTEFSPPAFPDAASLNAYTGSESIEHAQLLTESKQPGHVDAATQGPWSAMRARAAAVWKKLGFAAEPNPPKFPLDIPDGSDGWYVRGQPVVCPAGTAPAMWAADGSLVTDHRVMSDGSEPPPPPCVPGGKSALTNAGASDPCSSCGDDEDCRKACMGGGGAGHGTVTVIPTGWCPPAPGYTWANDGLGNWALRPLVPGATPKCRTSQFICPPPANATFAAPGSTDSQTDAAGHTHTLQVQAPGYFRPLKAGETRNLGPCTVRNQAVGSALAQPVRSDI